MIRRVTPDHERDLDSILEVDPVLAEIGKRIAAARKSKKLTQIELGNLCATQVDTVARAERGTQNYTMRTLLRIATALDLELCELIPPTRSLNKQVAQPTAEISDALSSLLQDVVNIGLTASRLRELTVPQNPPPDDAGPTEEPSS